MSTLQDALNYWSGMEEMSTCDRRHLRRIVDAARLVANPNIEAVAILICKSVFGEDWDGEIPLVQLNQAKRYVAAALTEGNTKS